MRELMSITKALADANRVRMALVLRKRELYACQLTELFGLAPSTMSQHFSILYQARLVSTRKDGRWEYDALPEGANMGLSCGNPNALAALQPGEVVLDLGAGGGFDVFIAGQKVGSSGRAIGVDMTPEMLAKARKKVATYPRIRLQSLIVVAISL